MCLMRLPEWRGVTLENSYQQHIPKSELDVSLVSGIWRDVEMDGETYKTKEVSRYNPKTSKIKRITY